MTTKAVKALKRNDWIICPSSGLAEQVQMAHKSGRPDRRFLRTNYHDHHLPYDLQVTVADGPTYTPGWEPK
jgi:hypothetical protein